MVGPEWLEHSTYGLRGDQIDVQGGLKESQSVFTTY